MSLLAYQEEKCLMRCTEMLILLAIAFSALNANASYYYQGHLIPEGWNVTFHNESSIEMTDGNSTMGLYNTTIPEIVSEWIEDADFPDFEVGLTGSVSNKFKEKNNIKLDNPPECRTFTTNQGLHPFGVDTIRMTYCDCGDYLFTWKTPGMDRDYTCLYAEFKGNYNTTLINGFRKMDRISIPTALYTFLS